MRRASALLLTALLAAPAWAGGDASDGHTHGEPARAPAPVVVASAAPRAAAASEDFEIVAALDGTHLTLYVDRFDSNAPVTGAKLETEGAGLKGSAKEVAPGTYLVDLAAALAPGRHALTIAIEAGEVADLLTATLEVAPPAPAEAAAGGGSALVERYLKPGLGAAALLLALGVAVAVWRRRTAART